LQDVYEQHCEKVGMKKEDPVLAHTERVRALHRQEPPLGVSALSTTSLEHRLTFSPLQRAELWNGRQEIAEEIAAKMIPDDILKKVRHTSSVLYYSR